MENQEIVFIEVPVNNKTKFVCDIVDKFYSAEKTVQIFVRNRQDAARLDEQLWAFKQDSFIPHTSIEAADADLDDPVLIVNKLNPDFKSDVLIQYDPVGPEAFTGYGEIIDFAELFDPNRLSESRKRYKLIRDSKADQLKFMKLGEFLSH